MADTTSTESNQSYENSPQWLFSFGASNVQTSSSRKGHMRFILDDKNTSVITAFTDRPNRLTGRVSMKNFAKNFDEIYYNNKPNTALAHWDADGSFYNNVCKIKKINKKW